MYRFFDRLARGSALLGGLVLLCLVIMTCLSIAGRLLNTIFHSDFAQSWFGGLAAWALDAGVGPVWGDFELVEAGMAFAIFAFIPICQKRGE